MNRRSFLIGIAQLTLGGIVVAGLPGRLIASVLAANPEARALGRSFKGTRDGQILESLDNGKTWQRCADFGQRCSIVALREREGQLYVQVGVQGHSFYLRSSDAHKWYTVEPA